MAMSDEAQGPLVEVSDSGLKRTRNWGLFINIATFLIGYTTSVIAGALLYMKGDLDLESLVTNRVSLDHVNDAFEAMERQEGIRTVIGY